ncbi:recombinase family protein [Chlorogloea sp. CCALA 695]|uniref:recombinase family protein n=1 Tax=Chlorogloea sp. CCALA 695 TaxID=2107693 RepID=UPI001E2B9655|nr:recombinase family protein [Chlorogloea sp. CCALA 695]
MDEIIGFCKIKRTVVTKRRARMWQRGELNAKQLPSGTVIVNLERNINKGVVIYTRVSSSENKSNLNSQAERLESYCTAKGYQIVRIVKEVGSQVNDNRRSLGKLCVEKPAPQIRKLIELLNKDDYSIIVV